MSFDPALVLMEDRPNRQVALQVLERLFHRDKLDVVLPQQRRIVRGEVGAQQIPPFASPHPAQLLAVERVDEHGTLLVHVDLDHAREATLLCSRLYGKRANPDTGSVLKSRGSAPGGVWGSAPTFLC